jgi:hypothetical protein
MHIGLLKKMQQARRPNDRIAAHMDWRLVVSVPANTKSKFIWTITAHGYIFGSSPHTSADDLISR